MAPPTPAFGTSTSTSTALWPRGAALLVALTLAACASKPPPPPARTARAVPAVRAPAPAPTTATAPAGAADNPAPAPVVAPATTPAAAAQRDGPDPMPPADLERVPDAEPALEPIRSGGPNKPYEVAGEAYAPITKDEPFVERGIASWYGRKFHGRRTASGEVYNMYAMTAAHKTLPIPIYARVRNPATGAEIVVRVNDRGPFVRGRIIDLSYTAALKLGVRGIAPVEVERITFEDIRSGAWRRNPATAVAAAAAPAAVPSAPATPLAGARPAAAPAPAEAVIAVAAAPPDEMKTAGAPLPAGAARPHAARPRLLGAARCLQGARRRGRLPPPASATTTTGWPRCSRCSSTCRCSVCRPAPTRAATRPAAPPSGSARRCSWCRWCSNGAEAQRPPVTSMTAPVV